MVKMPWFDLVRGLAALAVCAGHLRNLLFKDFAETGDHSIFQKLFYFITGLGHEAVIIFFVLSGCLVGGAVWSKAGTGAWSWRSYLLARGTRLWIVLIPALLATFIWDRLGLYYFGQSIVYTQEHFGHILPTGVWSNGTGINFLGNLLFVQTILVPPFGSNGPLWSLANEFWYYLLFPVFVLAYRQRSAWRGVCWVVLGLSMLAFVGLVIASYAFIWLMGVWVAVWLKRCDGYVWMAKPFITMAGVVLLVLGLVLLQLPVIKQLPEYLKDVMLGGVCSISLLALAKCNMHVVWEKVAAGLSRISYSLYLLHLPVVVFMCAWVMRDDGTRLDWAWSNLEIYLGLLGGVLAYSTMLYFVFEANTDRLRILLSGKKYK